MTRTTEVNTGRYALAYTLQGGRLVFVANSDRFFEREKAELFLSDRKANGEAFEGEQVAEVWAHLQWFGEATAHNAKGENARVCGWLFPKV